MFRNMQPPGVFQRAAEQNVPRKGDVRLEPVLHVHDLSITFTQNDPSRRDLEAVRRLSLTVEAGQLTALIGSSGSGKSLLGHSIFGILPDNAAVGGEIRYRGQTLTPQRAERLRGREIVLIPQGVTYLDPLRKVGSQVCGGRGNRARVRDALGRYGLPPETAERYPFELSGGMARRVLIAAAVVNKPRFVVADEPTPGLDPRTARRILGHLKELAQDGAGVLLITHDLEQALTVADRVAVLYAGETVEEADAGDFAAGRLRHPFSRALWDALPENGFRSIPGTQPAPGETGTGCPFAPRCPRRSPACLETEPIPYRPVRGGLARCLHPEGEELS